MYKKLIARVTVYPARDPENDTVLAEFADPADAKAYVEYRAATTLDDWRIGWYIKSGRAWDYQGSIPGKETDDEHRARRYREDRARRELAEQADAIGRRMMQRPVEGV
jgi:hypothetical protein